MDSGFRRRERERHLGDRILLDAVIQERERSEGILAGEIVRGGIDGGSHVRGGFATPRESDLSEFEGLDREEAKEGSCGAPDSDAATMPTMRWENADWGRRDAMLGMVPVASSQMQRKNTFSTVTLAVLLFRLLPPSAWMHTSVDASDGALFPRLCVRYCATIQYRVQYVNLTYPRNDKYSGTGARQAAIQPPPICHAECHCS